MRKYNVTVNGKSYDVDLLKRAGSQLQFQIDNQQYEVDVAPIFRPIASQQTGAIIAAPTSNNSSQQIANSNEVCAPMPGIVVSIQVKEGASVKEGQTVLVMEAMKMENNIAASKSGKIKTIHVKANQEVSNGQLLITIE